MKKQKSDEPEIQEETPEVQEEAQQEDYKDKYLRALADYHNLENRIQQLSKQTEQKTTQRIIEKFLDILDHLEKAEIFVKDPGLQMVQKSFMGALADLGVQEIEVLNKEYDPYVAECIEVVSGDTDNIVVEVLRKGYQLGDRVLRPAQVKVSKSVTN